MHFGFRTFALLGSLLLSLPGCNAAQDANPQAAEGGDSIVTAGFVDSIFPMPEMIARFQREQRRAPSGLGATAPASRDALVALFIAAVEAGNGAALAPLRIDAAEFAYLYFPTSLYSRAPYEQPPAVQWLLMDQNSLKGEQSLIRKLGGRPLGTKGYKCEEPAVREGSNEIWNECRLILQRSGAVADTVRLFGSIMGRDGRYKFVSITNEM